MTDDTQKILAELRIHRTILLELTADVAALKLGVCAAVKADGLTAGQVSDMMADLTRQMKNRFSEYDVRPDDEDEGAKKPQL